MLTTGPASIAAAIWAKEKPGNLDLGQPLRGVACSLSGGQTYRSLPGRQSLQAPSLTEKSRLGSMVRT